MHIYTAQLKYLNVALPTLCEQVAISRFLDHVGLRIQRHIRAKQKMIGLLEGHNKPSFTTPSRAGSTSEPATLIRPTSPPGWTGSGWCLRIGQWGR